jgi:hypothetical protein
VANLAYQRLADVETRDELEAPGIAVVEACGEWFVHVVEDGQEQIVSFDLESFALSFAEGQRRRLGLSKFSRL